MIFEIARGNLLEIVEHPDQKRYGGQRLFVVGHDDYAFLVPFVEDDKAIFLKTIIPSRKATRHYLRREKASDET